MKYKRWVGLGRYKLGGLMEIARGHGMKIIVAFKPAMHFYYELGLFGKKEQMEQVDKIWKAEHRVLNKKPNGACNFNVNISKEKWIENYYVSNRGIDIVSNDPHEA